MTDIAKPLMTSDPGSFAQYTILNRLPAIVDRVLATNPYPEEIRSALLALRRELIEGKSVSPLTEETPDRTEWDAEWARYAGRSWLDIPWYFAEAFFYRRLLEAVRYFQSGPWRGWDPFKAQKQEELRSALPRFASVATQLPADPRAGLFAFLLFNLWSNRADLTFDSMVEMAYAGLEHDHDAALLIDHRELIWQALANGVRRVDFVNDNAGLELLWDLALAAYLLALGLAQEVRFHLKSQPFFVSDAMIADVHETLDALRERAGLDALARRLEEHRRQRKLLLFDEPFWVTARGFERMPASLRKDLSASDLVFFKGDANYRRLLDDRAWPPDASLAALTRYFPAPYATIRVIKAELIVDLRAEQVERLKASDPTWMVNGRYGLIQFIKT